MMAAGLTLAAAQAYDIPVDLEATGLKTLVIQTVEGEEPVCDPVEAPPGSWGVGITNVNKVPGSVLIVDTDGTVLYDSGAYEKKESGMTIKVRGNTSALHAKKPFKIKLEKKADLLLRGDKDLRDKNWVLLSNRNNLQEIGFLTGKLVGMSWAPEGEYVNVVINDDYRGLYLLAEAVERNETCRIRTAETGFIAERDPYWWNENGEYLPSVWNPEFNWTMKYPDFEDLDAATTGHIESALGEFEKVISTEDYEDVIDTDSFCRWIIAQDILGTIDGGGTNFYLARYDDNPESKLFVPVLWDVDSGEDTEGDWSAVHREGMIAPLFDNTNPAFRLRYISLYKEISGEVFAGIEKFTESLLTEGMDGFNRAVELNNIRWPEELMYTSQHNAADMQEWFPARKLWLDGAVAALELETGVDEIKEAAGEGEIEVFTLDGRRIHSGREDAFRRPAPGVYIVKGAGKPRKVIYQ